MIPTITCQNCEQAFSGNYCPHCGQDVHTHRISFKALLHDIPHTIFHVDKGLRYTAVQLLIRPGKAIAEYLEGKRVRHFKPFAYLIILSTISSFVSHTVRNSHSDPAHPRQMMVANTAVNRFIAAVKPFFDHYQSMFFLVMIPVVSFFGWLLFKSRTQYNYWEHIVLNTYITAQFNFLLIAMALYSLPMEQDSISFTPGLFVFFTYLSITYGQFFRSGPHRPIPVWHFALAILLIIFVYVTGLSLTGIMTPWWGW